MNFLFQDLRYGLRSLLRQPLFTGVAVLVLGLGIGANTAVFSLINAVMLRPLPYPEPDRLMILHESTNLFASGSVGLPNFLDWQASQQSFDGLAMYRRDSCNLSFPAGNGAEPERVIAGTVMGNFLTILGIRPELGRNFTAEEDAPGGSKVVLLSDGFWRRRFGADPGAVGQSVMTDGISRQVVGVLPAWVRLPRAAEIYVPLGDLRNDPTLVDRGNHAGFAAVGRLKRGVTPALAAQDLNRIAAELDRRYPDTNRDRRVNVQSLLETYVGDYRASLYLLLGAVGCVLLIACANVANLQLARAIARRKEIAVRTALGASRWRLVRQMLTETLLLGFGGGALGLLIALWGVDAILALSPVRAVRFQETRLDFGALCFAAAAALGTGVLVGVWPAWRASRTATLSATLNEGGTRSTGGLSQWRARAVLVVAQVALAVVLLTGAGLTVRTFWNEQTMPLGFRPDGILSLSISLPESHYQKEKITAFYAGLLERVRALPGVQAAATGVNMPFDDNEWDSYFHLTGTPPNEPGQEPSAEMNFVSLDYFKVMGMPILSGRDFGPQEQTGQPRSAIIDESFARRYFPGQNPLGQHIDDTVRLDKGAPPLTVVGVVARTRNDAPGETNFLDKIVQMHLCTAQLDTLGDRTLLVRVASGDPLQLAEPVRRVVLSLDPNLPVGDVSTMGRNIAASLAPHRLMMVLLGAFAGVALLLAGVGLYGVMSLSVTQRTRELGIRLALGAQRRSVLRLVLGQGARLIGLGLVLGLAGALGLSRLMSSLLYGVSGTDPVLLAGVSLLLGGVALLACWLPARRATRVDPLVALREE